ncbi:MAG: DUF2071 domain-containing protein [Fimbriimonas ginsengisoli]|uniref:DUF2071 domain-containing protein n=1 Tax=Fimbriimonas ginsengisoli TaxID=1005039 RepID=A0A931LXP7_FIMGI|nr:DUF2071 domain-containing protein [Fimbriimonas ginsengisoli]
MLSAEWRWLAILNYEIEPALLAPLIPPGTEFDLWQGRCVISIVGFRFLRTRMWGLSLLGHGDFDEINLRFYVRREAPDGERRGVVFIKEIVPRRAVVWVARTLYGENYHWLPIEHEVRPEPGGRVEYRFKSNGAWGRMGVTPYGLVEPLVAGSEAEFTVEHYWGYTKRGACTSEYQVDHPCWRVASVRDAVLEGDLAGLYGPDFAAVLSGPPASALLAEGSAVTVGAGHCLDLAETVPNHGYREENA